MTSIKGKLDAWLVLQTIIDQGGFAQAAQALGRSQSAISYAIANLQDQLGLKLLQTQGRRAVLTVAGERLLTQARLLLVEHAALNSLAEELKDGREPLLRLELDSIVPMAWMGIALEKLSVQYPGTRIQLRQLSAPSQQGADLALSRHPLANWSASLLSPIQLIPVAHSEHPLAQAAMPLTHFALSQYPQVEITPSPNTPRSNLGWALQRSDHALGLIRRRLAFGWLPMDEVQSYLESGELKVLSLGEDGRRLIPIYMLTKTTQPGPALRALMVLLSEITRNRAGLSDG